MPGVSNGIGWIITLALVNYLIYSVTGIPPMWGFLCNMGKQLGLYVQLVNLGLAVALIIGGAWYGLYAAIKVGLILVGFNMVPHVAAALFAFGKTC